MTTETIDQSHRIYAALTRCLAAGAQAPDWLVDAVACETGAGDGVVAAVLFRMQIAGRVVMLSGGAITLTPDGYARALAEGVIDG